MIGLTREELVAEIKRQWPEHALKTIGFLVPPVRDGGTTDTLINLSADVAMETIDALTRSLDLLERGVEIADRGRWWSRQH